MNLQFAEAAHNLSALVQRRAEDARHFKEETDALECLTAILDTATQAQKLIDGAQGVVAALNAEADRKRGEAEKYEKQRANAYVASQEAITSLADLTAQLDELKPKLAEAKKILAEAEEKKKILAQL
mgnify:CR=1 FL=1